MTKRKKPLTQWELNKLKVFFDKYMMPKFEKILDEFEDFSEAEGIIWEKEKAYARLYRMKK